MPQNYLHEPIAIVGSGCRFPGGADTPSKLWELVCEKRDVSSDIPESRFNIDAFYHPNGERSGNLNTKRAYLLQEDVRKFDASFFNINPREAEAIDPQQRLLMETVYEALESGGLTIEGLRGSNTAVYVGTMTGDYNELMLRDPDNMPKYIATGTARSILSNRISYFFDWKGPSMTIDTACSSSLVAVHQAVQSLRSGESSVAVAGGANIILGPELMISESKLHMLSPSGRSHMWDSRADGYARGEGVAAVVLKTLSQAIRDGDSIQCIIRETGVNSDGRTMGITMPGAEAQTALIRQTYERAGLDITDPKDRCGFFEAHGTGTPAGDPVEARAIRDAFFDNSASQTYSQDILYVGSVKTIIGHLEGCAGLAGLLRAAQAVQSEIIPPNLHFEKLNPEITPYYHNLRIPTEAQPWPVQAPGVPRRASVNSFGFGGTNSHAIVESFDPSDCGIESAIPAPQSCLPIPLVFSAHSESSLSTLLERYLLLMKSSVSPAIDQLAWNLQSRKTQHSYRAAFSGASKEKLITNVEASLLKAKESSVNSIGTRSKVDKSSNARIVGVFTGQGAQWGKMARDLLLSSPLARSIISELDDALKSLPDPPVWNLMDEMSQSGGSSRITEAAFSQPLCTAAQVLVVDLLQLAGITFNYVVGHSSGEISAAYAAGMISRADAIRIAYYRGLHAHLAGGLGKAKGAMMAVGISYEEAIKLCKQPLFVDRIEVAANNAPQSVTLSGDKDAIEGAKVFLDELNTFARILKVDTAYHSRHMIPCSEPYTTSILACNIQPKLPRVGCTWISSVHGHIMQHEEQLKSLCADYWKDNMVNPILFADAVAQIAMLDTPVDIAIEVGPHPALKGPFTQVYKHHTGTSVAYSGTLARGENDVDSLSATLSFVWTQLGASQVNFASYNKAFSPHFKPQVLQNLPKYSWDHEKAHWYESRYSKNFRQRKTRRHDLLGARCPNDIPQELKWRNIIRLDETPWLAGHRVESQIVFPAAGYLVMAMEAAKELVADSPIDFLELFDVSISRAIAINDDSNGAETMFTLCVKDDSSNSDEKTADWDCYASLPEGTWMRNACGSVRIRLGTQENSLPPRTLTTSSLNPIDTEKFYSSLSKIGLEYTGLFKRLESIERKMYTARAKTAKVPSDHETPFVFHPALLDSSFQAVFAAFSSPGDGSLHSAYVPTHFDRISVAAQRTLSRSDEIGGRVLIDAFVTDAQAKTVAADVDIFDEDSGVPLLQLEGMTCTLLDHPNSLAEKELFAYTAWDLEISSGLAQPEGDCNDMPEELELVDFCERLSYFYLRKLNSAIDRSEISSLLWHHQRIFEFIDNLFPIIESGNHATVRKEWSSDTAEFVLAQAAKYSYNVDVQLIQAVGKHLPAVMRGETTVLEHMMEDNILNKFYKIGLGQRKCNLVVSRIAKQISHRYPSMNILEIGAGTGGITEGILSALSLKFKRYAFTDLSSGFFEGAQSAFAQHAHKMDFKTLNIEKDPAEQGFAPASYDLIIASNVLHATKCLSETMENTRKLLRPGGYLILLEITSDILRVKLMMSGLPGWWLGSDDGRHDGPTIGVPKWDALLKKCGFSGVDNAIADFDDTSRHMMSVMVSQAVDDNFMMLREPSQFLPHTLSSEHLTIVGGNSSQSHHMSTQIEKLFRAFENRSPLISTIPSLEAIEDVHSVPSTSFIFLQDLDEPILRNFSEAKLKGLQLLVNSAQRLLYITSGSQGGDPFSEMSIGLARVLQMEYQHLDFQLLDVGLILNESSALRITEAMLRLITAERLADTDQVLWTSEPELVLQDDRALIPRLMTDSDLNRRLNFHKSSAGRITSTAESVVNVVNRDNVIRLEEPSHFSRKELLCSTVQIKVSHSTLHAINMSSAISLFLCLGKVGTVGNNATNMLAGSMVMALSETNGSTIHVPSSQLVPLTITAGSEVCVLQEVAYNLIASHVIKRVPSGSALVLVDPDSGLNRAVRKLSLASQVEVVAISTNPTEESKEVVFVHPNTPRRELRAIIPSNVGLVISNNPHSKSLKLSALKSCLPKDCAQMDAERFVNTVSKSTLHVQDLQGIIFRAVLDAQMTVSPEPDHGDNALSLNDISNDSNLPRRYDSVIDFTINEQVTVASQPIDKGLLFGANKTYLLVGCSGGLGKSLCRFMVSNGARHLVLTSRNPLSSGSEWIDELRQMGAEVDLFQLDIADKSGLEKIRMEIHASKPPIAGIVNAAMVLSDRLFKDMNFEDFDKVLKPKVDGSMHLDQLFAAENLDFFVFFSSISNVIGNAGQSNYSAANMFMAGLAAQRRKKGLVGSCLHIGMVMGIGYVAQHDDDILEAALKRSAPMPISELNFHEMFTEAIVAGYPDSGHGSDLITGLNRYNSHDVTDFWQSNPRFSHHTLLEASSKVEKPSASSLSLLKRVHEAVDEAGRMGAIREDLLLKLNRLLQVPAESIDQHQPLVNLGIDSLMAVEIRSWFLKQVKTDMPVLKILGGASLDDLCQEAASQIAVQISAPLSDIRVPEIKVDKTITEPPEPSKAQDPARLAMQETVKHAHKSDWPEREPKLLHELGASLLSNNRNENQRLSHAFETRHSYTSTSTATQSRAESVSESVSDILVSNGPPSSVTSDGIGSERAGDFEKSVLPMIEPQIECLRTSKMSFAQERLWSLQRHLREPAMHNVTMAYRITGPLKVSNLEQAFNALIDRHETLRTRFFQDLINDEPCQAVLSFRPFILEKKDLANIEDVDVEFQRFKDLIYDLEYGETMRGALLGLDRQDYILVMGFHHITLDGFSAGKMIQDFRKLYLGMTLPPLKNHFMDFAMKQRTARTSGMAKELEYWKSEFNTLPPVLPCFQFDEVPSRSAMASYKMHTVELHIPQKINTALKAAGRKMGATPFNLHLATVGVFLHRLLKVDDVCIGVVDANMNDPEFFDTLGMFANLLPIRLDMKRNQSFAEVVDGASKKVLTAFEHSRMPFEALLDELAVPRSNTHAPLFQVMVNYRMFSNDELSFGECKSKLLRFEDAPGPHDLLFEFNNETNGSTRLSLRVQDYLYSEKHAQILVNVYHHLLQSLCNDASTSIDEHTLFGESDAGVAPAAGETKKALDGATITISELDV